MIDYFVKRFGAYSTTLLLVAVVVTVAWFGSAVIEYQRFIDWGLKLTHQWLKLLIQFSSWIHFGWLTDNLQTWSEGLPPVIRVKDVIDVPDMDLFYVWLVWMGTFVVLWVLGTLLSKVFGKSDFVATTRDRDGGGGGTARSGRQEVVYRIGIALGLALVLLVLYIAIPAFSNMYRSEFGKYQADSTLNERVNTQDATCVPDVQNVLQYSEVDQCIGIYSSSNASEAAKEKLHITLGVTCNAFDSYASQRGEIIVIPAWMPRQHAKDLPPENFGLMAQRIADQGIPCSLPDSNEPKPEKNRSMFFMLVILLPMVTMTAMQIRNPATDGAGTTLPFSEQRKRWGVRVAIAILVMAIIYAAVASIF